MGWVSRKKYCEKEDISYQAYKKRKAKGLIQWRYGASGRGGEAGKHIEVYINDSNPSQRAASGPEGSPARRERIAHSEKPKAESKPKDRTRIHRGEPGCREMISLVNGEPMIQTGCPQGIGISDPTIRANRVCDPPFPEREEGRECVASTVPTPDHIQDKEQHPGDPLGQCASATQRNLPAPLSNYPYKNQKAERIANLRFAVIQAFNEEAAKNHRPRAEIIRHFLDSYNSGVLLPDIHAELKHIKRSTLYNWLCAATPDALAPQYGRAGQSKITDHEKNLVLTLVLHQNRLKIAYAITLAKEYLAKKEIPSPSGSSTLRRFVDQYKKEHYDIWIRRREGDKALNDKVLPYAERDWSLLDVGDGLVADGHRLNFQIIHPMTGKPCRAMLVLFWDWRSSYPLGWEIMIEENIQCVASALRNAILSLGKIPKWVLLDNGKAFRAKIFTEDISFEDTELPGMFARLNINYHFAQPYNAQAKPIERIFGILNEQLERLVPSYTGASINDKPAWTKRNEKYARSLHNPHVPTIQETNDLIRAWRDRYAERSSRGRDGLRPIDIYNNGKGPGVDPNELIYLMMDREIKGIHRNGITWLGWHWFDEAMYGLKDRVVIRYSLSDLSQIYVFHKNEFLCAAKPIEKVHPMASESDNPKDMEAVKVVYRLKNKVKNTTRKLCDLLDSKPAAQIDWSRTRSEEISETIQKIEEAKKPKVVKFSPFADAPQADVETRADGDAEINARPRWKYDFEKYDWLMTQEAISEKDKRWIDQYRATSSAFKNVIGGKQ